MTALAILESHHGGHCAPRTPVFRRMLAALHRKPAPEAASPVSRAAPPLLGAPVPGYVQQMSARLTPADTLAELVTTDELAALHPRGEHPYPVRPTILRRPDGSVVIDTRHAVHLFPDDRNARPPWPPAEQPAGAEPQHGPRPDDTRTDLPVARPVPDVALPVYGEKCVLDVEQAERMRAEMGGLRT